MIAVGVRNWQRFVDHVLGPMCRIMTNKPAFELDSQPTQWSLIDAVAAGDREALDQLLERYLDAFRHYLTCTLRCQPDVIDDLLQQFLQVKFLEQNIAARVDRQTGFRRFIYQSLKNFVRDYFRREQRRSAGQVPLDEDLHEPLAAEHTDGDSFDVAWADHVLREALRRVHRECQTKGQQRLWSIFESRLLRPFRDDVPPVAYEVLQQQLQFDSPTQAANALETAKRKLRQHLQDVIAEYAGRDSASIDSELGNLRAALTHAKHRPLTSVADLSSGHSAADESVLSTADAPQRLARVLDLTHLDSPLWLPDESAAILRDEMSCPIESACDDQDFLPAFREQARAAESCPRTLAELFTTDAPPLWLLELVKRWSKTLLRSAQPPIPKEVAYVLHYGCVCAGIRAGLRAITRSSDADVLQNVQRLLGYSWIGEELQTLFEQTRSALKET